MLKPKMKGLHACSIGFLLVSITFLTGFVVEATPTLAQIKEVASTPEPGDVLLMWAPGFFWEAPYVEDGITKQVCTWPALLVERDDGTTVWIENNFYNIANATGENYLRFINETDEIAFYAKLDNVTTQWGGIAWATPNVIFAGRIPASWAQMPTTGGYPWFSLPMNATDLANYEHIYVYADYDVAHSPDTLVRWGLMLWFEDPEGNAIGEVYISFYDTYGGWVGDRTEIGEITTMMVANGEVVDGCFKVQRALSGGGWAGMEFLSTMEISSGEVTIDIKPLVDKVIEQLESFFGLPKDSVIWSDLVIGAYSGSEGTSYELGWMVHDVRVLSPEEATATVNLSSLLELYAKFAEKYQRLVSEYNELNANYASLNESYGSLQEEYRSLESEINELNANYASLNESYQELQSNYESLRQSYENIKTQTYLTYIFIATTIIFLATTIYFAKKRK